MVYQRMRKDSRPRAQLTTTPACIFNEPLAVYLWGENYAYCYIKSNEKNTSEIVSS